MLINFDGVINVMKNFIVNEDLTKFVYLNNNDKI